MSFIGKEYHLYTLPFDYVVVASSKPLDPDPEVFYIDRLQESDLEFIQSNQTVAYSPEYILLLINQQPFSQMNCCIRSIATKEPVSLALSHLDMSIGLITTSPRYRNQGFASFCLLQVCRLQRKFLLGQSQQIRDYYAFVAFDNAQSTKLLTRNGFSRSDLNSYFWGRVDGHH